MDQGIPSLQISEMLRRAVLPGEVMKM